MGVADDGVEVVPGPERVVAEPVGTCAEVTATINARGATEPPEKYEGVAKGFTQPPTKEAMVPYGDLTDLSVTFVMPAGRYTTTHGRIVRQTDAGPVTLVSVRADATGEETRITVLPEKK